VKRFFAAGLALLALGLAPTVAPASHCKDRVTAEVWGEWTGNEIGRIGCAEGRAEIADTNYITSASEYVYMVSFAPNASAEAQAPSAGVLKFNIGANKTMVFTWSGSYWESNHITIPEGASSVTASACIRPEAGSPCKTLTLRYQII
jgi:hypothetical protein